jgi:adenosine deaminase
MLSEEAFVLGLPKAELHMHIEGAIEPELLLKLAQRNGIDLAWSSPQEVRAAYKFTDLRSFLLLFYEGLKVMRREEDFYEVTNAYLRRAYSEGVRHAEMFIGPQGFLEQGVELDDLMNGVLRAMRDGETAGISSKLLISTHRHRTEEAALDLLERIEPWLDQIAGIGMGGPELGNPPTKFTAYFKACREKGLRLSIHSGEEAPASYVRDSIDVLGVDRIDHGNACMDDPSLVDNLRSRAIPLTICPVSNLKTNVVASLKEHPLKAMMDAGLCVTVNSDDPAFFGSYIHDNFMQIKTALNLSTDDIVTLARNSFIASYLSEHEIAARLADIDDYVAEARLNGAS